MTNNTEKLYELAKVKKVGKKLSCSLLDFGACKNINCIFCDKAKLKEFPPFTDTKQLELIKWIAKNLTFGVLVHTYDSKFRFNVLKNRSISHKDFSQALAGLVCELWQDLTEAQREEVRGILQ